MRKLKRIQNTNWYSMAIPAHTGAGPRKMAVAARGLPGVISAVADPVLYINDTIPPNDPYYVDDDNPGEDCDIVGDPSCMPEDLVDQWGLFKVEAESILLSGGRHLPVEGLIYITSSRFAGIAYGDRLQIAGMLESLSEFPEAGFSAYLARQGMGVLEDETTEVAAKAARSVALRRGWPDQGVGAPALGCGSPQG